MVKVINVILQDIVKGYMHCLGPYILYKKKNPETEVLYQSKVYRAKGAKNP
jgi:hypothetical protein